MLLIIHLIIASYCIYSSPSKSKQLQVYFFPKDQEHEVLNCSWWWTAELFHIQAAFITFTFTLISTAQKINNRQLEKLELGLGLEPVDVVQTTDNLPLTASWAMCFRCVQLGEEPGVDQDMLERLMSWLSWEWCYRCYIQIKHLTVDFYHTICLIASFSLSSCYHDQH